jgi:hypothetical protein
MSEPSVTLYPPWKQAARDFLAEHQYGSIVTHQWLADHFGMPDVGGAMMTAEEFQERQFEWLSNIEAFKTELLQQHQVYLESIRGKGYRWVPPQEQTRAAMDSFERDARRAFRTTGQRLQNLRVGELTNEERRENADAAARLAMVSGMAKRAQIV